MKYILLTLVPIAIFAACGPTKKKEGTDPTTPVTLKPIWETDTLLNVCESVVYDQERDVLYVSNINGPIEGKRGKGFISKVTLDGKISNRKWITGIDAPKGLGLFKEKLYAADNDKIREIDVISGKVTNTFTIKEAKFLNDITVDASGKVYASDSRTGDIFVLENEHVAKWLSGIGGPNGLLAEDKRMLMLSGTDKTLSTIDFETLKITSRTDSLEYPDGVEAVGDGAYLVSCWKGLVYFVGPDWKKNLILDTRGDSINAADIKYIPEKKLLLVPAFFKNKVMAYELSR